MKNIVTLPINPKRPWESGALPVSRTGNMFSIEQKLLSEIPDFAKAILWKKVVSSYFRNVFSLDDGDLFYIKWQYDDEDGDMTSMDSEFNHFFCATIRLKSVDNTVGKGLIDWHGYARLLSIVGDLDNWEDGPISVHLYKTLDNGVCLVRSDEEDPVYLGDQESPIKSILASYYSPWV